MNARIRHCAALLCLLLLVPLCGCNSRAIRGEALPNPLRAGEPVTPLAPGSGGAPGLAAPVSLAQLVKTPSTVIQWRSGLQYEAALPSARLTPEGQLTAVYTPTGRGAAGVAYGIYSFNLGGLPSAAFKAKWSYIGEPLDLEFTYFIGFANWTTNRWDWFPVEYRYFPHAVGPEHKVDLAAAASYQRADGLSLAAVVIPGTTSVKLSNLGFAASAMYDEVEPNNSAAEARPLPPAPVYAFRGSLGKSVGWNAGYDGSTNDYFELTAQDGETLTIGLLPTGQYFSSHFNEIELTNRIDPPIRLNPGYYDMTLLRGITYNAAAAPYILRVTANETDYELYVIPGSTGDAPETALSVSPGSGPAPLTVTLDAGASSDPNPGGAIVRYDWDFDSDGVWDIVGGTDPVVQHTYEADGVYFARVRVGNALGLGRQDAAWPEFPGRRTITVGSTSYDEVEDNDGTTPQGFNALPSFPFSEYKGNVGYDQGGAGPVNDGDSEDWFCFHAEAGQVYSFLDDAFYEGYMNDGLVGSNVSLSIRDSAGDYITGINGFSKSVSFVPSATGDYRLRLSAGSNSAGRNYLLRGINKYPPVFFGIQTSIAGGVGPLTVTCSVAATDPDSTQLTYGWALDHPYPSPAYGTQNTQQFTLTRLGANYIHAFVTDETGLRYSGLPQPVYVWAHPYEEVEPNDKLSQAQVLSALPVSGFRGSVGGLNDGGYDGHGLDIYKLGSITPGETLRIAIYYTAPGETFTLRLRDGAGDILAQTAAAAGQAVIQHVAAAGQQPYSFELEVAGVTTSSNIDYTLDLREL